MNRNPEKNLNLPNKVIIGKGQISKYLYNFFLKAYNYDEILLQYHDRNVGTAKTLIDGLKNFGWLPTGDIERKKITGYDRERGEEYDIIVNVVVIEKIGAIRGL